MLFVREYPPLLEPAPLFVLVLLPMPPLFVLMLPFVPPLYPAPEEPLLSEPVPPVPPWLPHPASANARAAPIITIAFFIPLPFLLVTPLPFSHKLVALSSPTTPVKP